MDSLSGPSPTGFLFWVSVMGIVQRLGGEVRVGEKQDYGRMEIEFEIEKSCGLFGGKRVGDRQVVWMNHGDEAAVLPNGFEVVARKGIETLRYFLFEVCGVNAGWKMENVLDEEIKVTNNTVGPDDHVICALSGGVHSTVAATLVHKAIGDRLHCVFVDNGLLRYKERERVMETFERDLHLPVTCVDATDQFLSKLKGVADPEMKRKIIGKEFICTFDAFAQELEHKIGKKPVSWFKEPCIQM
ncbi:hypothetical protein CRYUN_Cryun07bG0153700 [Craigia yunnanensis]